MHTQCPSKVQTVDNLTRVLARTGVYVQIFYLCILNTHSISFKKLHIDGLLMSLKAVMLCFVRREFRRGQFWRQCLRVCTAVQHRHNRSSLGMRGTAKRPVSILSWCEPVLYRVTVIRSGSKAGRELGQVNKGLHCRYAPSLESGSILPSLSNFTFVSAVNSALSVSWQFFGFWYSISKFLKCFM